MYVFKLNHLITSTCIKKVIQKKKTKNKQTPKSVVHFKSRDFCVTVSALKSDPEQELLEETEMCQRQLV